MMIELPRLVIVDYSEQDGKARGLCELVFSDCCDFCDLGCV